MKNSLSNHIFCIGMSYKESTVTFREYLSFEHDELPHLLKEIAQKSFVKEVLILSTCNRFEVYGVLTDDVKDHQKVVSEIWSDVFFEKKLSGSLSCALEEKLYSVFSKDAISHAFKVFTSLDSLCIGETQITGQFKKALQLAQEHMTAGPVLKRLCHDAVLLNKKIRNQTMLGKNEKSIGQMAIDLSLHIFSSIKNKSIVLIGAGKMIELAYKYAISYEPKSITVINRTKSKAEEIVKNHKNSFVGDFSDLPKSLMAADIILSSTAAPDFILYSELLSSLQRKRKNKPLFLIDIALPRDIDPKCSEIENVYLFDLDDIRKIVKIKNENYKEDLEKAEILIEKRNQGFHNWLLENIEKNPILSDLSSYLKEIFSKEKERTLGKNIFNNITEDQKKSLDRMLHSISQKILSDTADSIKKSQDPDLSIFSYLEKKQLKEGLKNNFTID